MGSLCENDLVFLAHARPQSSTQPCCELQASFANMSQVVVELPGVAGDSQPLHECSSMVSKKQLHVQGQWLLVENFLLKHLHTGCQQLGDSQVYRQDHKAKLRNILNSFQSGGRK